MLKVFGNDLFNIAFRGGPLAIKFILFLIIPIYYGNRELGLFGVVIASISIISSLIGLEIYQITNRIFAKNQAKYYRVIFSYAPLYLFAYLIIIPAAYFILYYLLPLKQSVVLLILAWAVTDHLLQEYYRLIIAAGQYKRANLFYFIKNGLWPLVFMGMLIFNGNFNYSLWSIVYTQVFILVYLIISNFDKLKSIRRAVELRFVSLASLYYLGNTLSKRAIVYLDRYVSTFYFGLEVAGLITFYTSIASALNQLVEAVTSVKFFKEFITSAKHEELINKYINTVNIYFGTISLFVLVAGYFGFSYIDPAYKTFLYLLIIYLSAYYLTNLSSAYHYSLYSNRFDADLFKITLYTVALYIILISTANYTLGIITFPIAVLVYGGVNYWMKRNKVKEVGYRVT